MRVAETWQLGSKEKDSGVLLLVAVNDKKMRIEVGYGLEANLTDAAAGRIIRNVIAPEFKTGNFGRGIFLGVKAIAGCALQDESMLSKINSSDDSDGLAIIIGLTALFIIWFIFCRLIPCFFWILYRLITLKGFTGEELVTNLFTSRSAFKFLGSSGGGGRGGYSGGGGSFGGGGASGSW